MSPSVKLLSVLSLLAAVLGVVLWFVFSDPGDEQLSGLSGGDMRATDTGAALVSDSGSGTAAGEAGERVRAAAGSGSVDPEFDPVIQAAMCGFRGRVIDHDRQPMPELVVELLRFAPDSVLGEVQAQADEPVFAPAFEPEFAAGRATTDDEGRFEITGVLPQAFYLLFAGVGAESTRMVVLDQTPGPGEMVDIGDIQIELMATITGVVRDEDGQPLGGALVRAADVPGAVTALVPIERIDPKGALIIHEGDMKTVIEAPAWVQRVFDRLPIPQTVSGGDGRFRLTGVAPGDNVLAVTAEARLSHVEPRVPLKAGQVKDVGVIRLREGDEVYGRVVDHEGAAVAGADVVVGQTLGFAPIALATMAGPTDADGRFSLTGFRGGRIVAAARRQQGDPWVVGEPQPVVRDVLLQLPAALTLGVRVVGGAEGAPIGGADFRLFPGAGDGGMMRAAAARFVAPADLSKRVRREEDGRYVFSDLGAGSYRLEVAARGYAVSTQSFELSKSAERTVALEPVSHAMVLVVDETDAPIRNATVYASKQGNGPDEMPMSSGRTGGDGRHKLLHSAAGEVRVMAHHPAYGWVSERSELPAAEDIRLVMRSPGTLRGVLTENGEPPPLGKFMIVISSDFRAGGGRGSGGMMPRLAAPDPLGEFEVVGLQPGSYRVVAVPSVRAISSLGSIVKMAQTARMFGRGDRQEVRIESGAVAETRIDVRSGPQSVDGPATRVTGTVLVNGQPGVGMMIGARSGARASAEVDERGRFDLGRVRAGRTTLRLIDTGNSAAMFSPLWEKAYELVADESVDITIDLSTGALVGTVRSADGALSSRSRIELSGVPDTVAGSEGARVRLRGASDDAGAFRFDSVPAGTYRVTASTGEGRAERLGVLVTPGASARVEIVLVELHRVEGTVDMTALGENPRWIRVRFHSMTGGRGGSSRVRGTEGTFSVANLADGTYRVEITAYTPKPGSTERFDFESREFFHPGEIEVRGNLKGLVLRPQPAPAEQPATPQQAGRAGR